MSFSRSANQVFLSFHTPGRGQNLLNAAPVRYSTFPQWNNDACSAGKCVHASVKLTVGKGEALWDLSLRQIHRKSIQDKPVSTVSTFLPPGMKIQHPTIIPTAQRGRSSFSPWWKLSRSPAKAAWGDSGRQKARPWLIIFSFLLNCFSSVGWAPLFFPLSFLSENGCWESSRMRRTAASLSLLRFTLSAPLRTSPSFPISPLLSLPLPPHFLPLIHRNICTSPVLAFWQLLLGHIHPCQTEVHCPLLLHQNKQCLINVH